MNTAPGGDAMIVRHHRDAEAALKREKLRMPIAWRLHADDAAQFAAERKHCQTRRCRNAISAVTWRWWRSAEAGRVLLAEPMVCDQHVREFASRHHIEIEPPPETGSTRPLPPPGTRPAKPSRRRGTRGTEGGAR